MPFEDVQVKEYRVQALEGFVVQRRREGGWEGRQVVVHLLDYLSVRLLERLVVNLLQESFEHETIDGRGIQFDLCGFNTEWVAIRGAGVVNEGVRRGD